MLHDVPSEPEASTLIALPSALENFYQVVAFPLEIDA